MGIIAEQWRINDRVQLTVHRATGLRRLTGLIGRAEPAPLFALRLPRCRSVHSFLMRRSLDLVFADAAGRALDVRTLAPWRMAVCSRATQVFELRAGETARLEIVPGTRLKLNDSPKETE